MYSSDTNHLILKFSLVKQPPSYSRPHFSLLHKHRVTLL